MKWQASMKFYDVEGHRAYGRAVLRAAARKLAAGAPVVDLPYGLFNDSYLTDPAILGRLTMAMPNGQTCDYAVSLAALFCADLPGRVHVQCMTCMGNRFYRVHLDAHDPGAGVVEAVKHVWKDVLGR